MLDIRVDLREQMLLQLSEHIPAPCRGIACGKLLQAADEISLGYTRT